MTIVDLQNPPIKRPFLILSDPLSSLQAIQNIHSDHPLAQSIHILLHTLTNSPKEIIFIWIPSHIGIKGNERIDQAAKLALTFPKVAKHLAATQSDLTTFLRHLITQSWTQYWQDQESVNNKLGLLKSTPTACLLLTDRLVAWKYY